MNTDENTNEVPNQSKGIGDTIAKLTKALGIDRAVKAATEAVGVSDCGCNKRQAKLNQMYPYKDDATTE